MDDQVTKAQITLEREISSAIAKAQSAGLRDGFVHAELERQSANLAELMFTKAKRNAHLS